MKPGFDRVTGEVKFMDDMAMAVMPCLISVMRASSVDVPQQMRRAARAAYDIATAALEERRLRMNMAFAECEGNGEA